MSPAAYVLDEIDAIGVEATLTDDAAAAVAQSGLVEVRPQGPDRWRLLPCGQVGVGRVNDIQVEVRPKGGVGLAHLIFLLGFA